MRIFAVVLSVCLGMLAGQALAQPAMRADAGSAAATPVPLTRLPDWAVPRSYQLQLRSDPAQAGYSGTVRIVVDLKRASDQLWLHGKGLKVARATVTDAHGRTHAARFDAEVSAAATDAGVARLAFGATLRPQQLTLTLDFSAPYNGNLQGYYKVNFAGNAYAMTQMEPISARYAFPCFDEPGFKVPLTLSLTIPNSDQAVANSAEAGSKPADQGWKTVAFETTRPLPTYLYAWAVGPWDIVQGPVVPPNRWRATPVPVRGIATRGNGGKMQQALAMVPGIIEHLEAYYGFGYPFGKLDLAALPDFSAGAMENAGLVTFRDWLLLLEKESAPGAVRSTFNVEAHELAHQWTGDIVTLQWWNDIWLNEAFATWMQQKITAEVHPEWHSRLNSVESTQYAMRSDGLSSARMIRQPITGNGDIQTAFDGITYQKGAAVLRMFEGFVGAQTFQKGMQAYIRAHAFGNADADALVGAITKAAGKGAAFTSAFNSFLNQNGVPLVSTKLDCDHQGGPVLQLTQSRYLPLGSTGDTSRQWGIPVCVRFAQGEQCQMLDERSGSLRISGGQCPAWYMPNANANGYYRYSLAKADRAALAKAVPQLNEAEQLAYADSIAAAFASGHADVNDILTAMHQLAPSQVRQISLAPLDTVGWVYDRAAGDKALKLRLRDAVAKAYLPRLQALGYQRRSGESADDVLLRGELASTLGLGFEVPKVRAALLQQGKAALKPGKDGLPNLMAANPDLLRSALSVAVEVLGKPAVDTLLAAVPKTTDPVRRNAMLGALSHAEHAEAEVVRNFALTPQVKVGEMGMLLRGGRDTAAKRTAVWTWYTAHYDAIVARTGVFSGAYLPMMMAGGSCSDAEAARVEAYFKPRLGTLPGLDRGLAQTVESIKLCSALKARQLAGASSGTP